MQFKKALVFDDKYIANTILKTKDREKMREYIKKEIFSENKNENYWKAIKYATMIEALKIQMENYPELIEKLKQTGNSTIVFVLRMKISMELLQMLEMKVFIIKRNGKEITN